MQQSGQLGSLSMCHREFPGQIYHGNQKKPSSAANVRWDPWRECTCAAIRCPHVASWHSFCTLHVWYRVQLKSASTKETPRRDPSRLRISVHVIRCQITARAAR